MLEKNLARFVLPKDLKLIEISRVTRGYIWHVEKVRQAFEICPRCANRATTRAGRCTSLVKDEPFRDEELWLKIYKHRYYCKHCRKPFTEPVSIVWPKRKTTQRLRTSIAKSCSQFIDLEKVRDRYRVSSGLIYKVFYEQLETKLRERRGAPWPEVLGIDEHFFSRRNGFTEFTTIFTDLKKKEIFEMAFGKDNKLLISQLMSIPGRERVKIVAIDLSSGYRALVKKMFPNARIVADKFHVLRLLTPSIMREGRVIHGHRQELKQKRLLLVNRSKLDYFAKADLDHYLRQHPKLNALYRAKERLFEVYRVKGARRAGEALARFTVQLKTSGYKELERLGRTLERWRSEVLLYFETGYTNAFTEAMNNVGKLVQKRAYGYRSFKNYRLRTLCARIF